MDLDRLNQELSSIAFSLSAVAAVVWLSISGVTPKSQPSQVRKTPSSIEAVYHSIIPEHYRFIGPVATTTRTESQLALALEHFQTGMAYYHGLDRDKDDITARMWFTKGAVEGSKEAQGHLAMMLLMGYGGDQDIERAMYWLNLSK